MIHTLQLGQFGRNLKRRIDLSPYLDGIAVLPMCAHGLRKLYSTATQCILVRNGTTGVETTIGFSGNSIDLAALNATFTGTENVFVKTIYDQSGNGRHFTQNTTTRQPDIVASGVYQGTIRFGGIQNAFMATASALPMGTPRWGIFVRHNFTALATRVFCELSTNSSGANTQAAMLYAAATNRMYMYSQNGTGAARQNWSDCFTGMAQRSWLFDRSIVGNTEEQARQSGSNQTMTNTGGSTEQTGNFSSYTNYVGARGDDTLHTVMSLDAIVQYNVDTTPYLSAIESIVGTAP